jgi:hypothetical protein
VHRAQRQQAAQSRAVNQAAKDGPRVVAHQPGAHLAVEFVAWQDAVAGSVALEQQGTQALRQAQQASPELLVVRALQASSQALQVPAELQLGWQAPS